MYMSQVISSLFKVCEIPTSVISPLVKLLIRYPLILKHVFGKLVISAVKAEENAKMTDKKQPVDMGLEEDDEFDEFPVEEWTGLDEDQDAHVWEDNWDDDNVEDDFSSQLRAELEKHGYKMETGCS